MPRPDKPLEELKTNLNGSKPKGPMEPLSHSQWQRSSDLTPEAWQQQVDRQLQQQETEQQAESWGNRNPPHHSSHQSDSVFKDSKSMLTNAACSFNFVAINHRNLLTLVHSCAIVTNN